MVLLKSAPPPVAVFSLPVVLPTRAVRPVAVLLLPVVLTVDDVAAYLPLRPGHSLTDLPGLLRLTHVGGRRHRTSIPASSD